MPSKPSPVVSRRTLLAAGTGIAALAGAGNTQVAATNVTSAAVKPVTDSLKTNVTDELLSVSLRAVSTTFTSTVGLSVSMATESEPDVPTFAAASV